MTRKVVANLQKAANSYIHQLFSDTKFRAAVLQWDIPWLKHRSRQLQHVAIEILQRALSELPSPIDFYVFSGYQFDLFSTLK